MGASVGAGRGWGCGTRCREGHNSVPATPAASLKMLFSRAGLAFSAEGPPGTPQDSRTTSAGISSAVGGACISCAWSPAEGLLVVSARLGSRRFPRVPDIPLGLSPPPQPGRAAS